MCNQSEGTGAPRYITRGLIHRSVSFSTKEAHFHSAEPQRLRADFSLFCPSEFVIEVIMSIGVVKNEQIKLVRNLLHCSQHPQHFLLFKPDKFDDKWVHFSPVNRK